MLSDVPIGNKENIVYIIIKTCIRRDDACRSTVFIHMLGLREIIPSLTDGGGQTYRTDTGSVPTLGRNARIVINTQTGHVREKLCDSAYPAGHNLVVLVSIRACANLADEDFVSVLLSKCA